MRSFNGRSFQGIIESDEEEIETASANIDIYEICSPITEIELNPVEKKQRENFMTNTKIALTPNDVKTIVTKAIPNDLSFTTSAISLCCLAGKIFTAELITLASQMNASKEPLTPDIICLAFQELEANRKIPGRGNGNIRRI